MKTAKEILVKHCPGFDPLFMDDGTKAFHARVLAAMEEYAKVYHRQRERDNESDGTNASHIHSGGKGGWSV